MAEIRRGFGETPSERLPWLEPVEDEEEDAASGGGGRIAAIALMMLVAIGLAVGAFMLFRHWRAAHADLGQIIHAPTTPYKEKPRNPGGLNVDGGNVVAQRTGAGADIDAPLDLAAVPEEPVTGPGSAAPVVTAQPAPTTRGAPTVPENPRTVTPPTTAVPAPPPAAPVSGGGGTIQLGAFSSQAKATAAWKALSGRFRVLDGMTMAISPVTTGDATLYRLRASGGGAATQACAALKVAGESCAVVG